LQLTSTRIVRSLPQGRSGENLFDKTPEVPRGTVIEGGAVTILDPEGRRLATIGSQAAP